MVPHGTAVSRRAACPSLGTPTYLSLCCRFRMHYEEVILVIQRCCSCWQNTHISICALVLFGSVLNIKEMLCIMMAQNGCLAGEMLCPHRNWCPQCCCRTGFFPAERGLFCGGRAMSCSHGCLHCLWLRVGTPSTVSPFPAARGVRGCTIGAIFKCRGNCWSESVMVSLKLCPALG